MPRTTNNVNTRIKLGADPEFVWFDGTRFVSACDVTTGYRSMTAELGVDGASNTGEMRPKPGTPMHVWSGINKILKQAAQYPYDMYAGSGRVVPTGGHIHFSGISHNSALLAKLDKFITIPLNEVSDRSSRHGYGQLSEVRSQSHGWEYRSPCSWIVHPIIAKGVLRIAWVLALATEMGRLSEINEVEDIVNFASNCDHPHATRCHVQDFYKMLKRMKRANIKLEQVEVFQAWKKKERRGAGTVTRRQIVPQVHFNLEDFGMAAINQQYCDRLCQAEHITVINTLVNVCGAAETRTTDKVVFIPGTMDIPTVDTEGVEYRSWDIGYVGLSKSLREEPELAARALYNVLKREETVATSNGNADILKVVEGKRS